MTFRRTGERDVSLVCPLCGQEQPYVVVLRQNDPPFACAQCASVRALLILHGESANIDAAAWEAWPDTSQDERDIRVAVLLYEWRRLYGAGPRKGPGEKVYDLMGTEAMGELMEGAARAGGWKT